MHLRLVRVYGQLARIRPRATAAHIVQPNASRKRILRIIEASNKMRLLLFF